MTDSLKTRFAMEADVLSLGLMAVVISSIVLVFVLTAQQVYAADDEPSLTPTPTAAPTPTLAPNPNPNPTQVYAAANEPTFRVVATKAQPEISLNKGQKWHLFLSHIWGTGQDQCANIKRQVP